METRGSSVKTGDLVQFWKNGYATQDPVLGIVLHDPARDECLIFWSDFGAFQEPKLWLKMISKRAT